MMYNKITSTQFTPPTISVVMPCYNNGAYVGQAIESVQNQTYGNWELIIVNDGSTDNSEEVINRYAQADKRIRYINQENRGVSTARNNGVKTATGEYICFLDADDWLEEECLKKSEEIFQEHQDLRAFYLKNWSVDEAGNGHEYVDYYGNYNGVLLWGMANHMVIRKVDFMSVGGYDEQMRSGWEDWDFSIRFLYHNCNVIVSDKCLYFYRQYSSEERVSNQAYRNIEAIQKYVYCKNIDIYAEYFGSPIMQCRWEMRRLPQLLKRIMNFLQKIHDWLNSIKKR